MINKKIILSFCLLLLSHNILSLSAYLFSERCEKLSELLGMPADTDRKLYQQYIDEELIPLVKEQLVKYHSHEGEPSLFIRETAWASSVKSISIPIEFVALAIKHRIEEYKECNKSLLNKITHLIYGTSQTCQLKKDLSFWYGIAAFHHEMTHIKKQHLKDEYEIYENIRPDTFATLLKICKYDLEKIKVISDMAQDYFEFSKKQEWEADEGIPNHRLMLLSIKTHYEQHASSPGACTGARTHPSDKDRAARFAQRLEILLKERAQAVSNALGLEELSKIPAPHNMPHASNLLNIASEHYESILDLIGEHKIV